MGTHLETFSPPPDTQTDQDQLMSRRRFIQKGIEQAVQLTGCGSIIAGTVYKVDSMETIDQLQAERTDIASQPQTQQRDAELKTLDEKLVIAKKNNRDGGLLAIGGGIVAVLPTVIRHQVDKWRSLP